MNDDIILDFINGPLKQYLEGKIEFSRFVDLTNLICDCSLTEEQLSETCLPQYESQKLIPTVSMSVSKEQELSDFDKSMRICHQYGLCIQKSIDLYMCGTCEICPREITESKAYKKGEIK